MTRTVTYPVRRGKAVKKPARNPVEGSRRATFARWMRILDSLRMETPPPGYTGNRFDWRPNAKQFAKAFGCHWRTIQRDLDALRDCGYQIEYDRSEHTLSWVNRRGVETLPLMTATEAELISLVTALAISHSVLDAGTAGHLRSFLGKLEQHLEGPLVYPLEVVQQVIHFQHTHATAADTALWTRLQRAILDQKGVTLDYSSPFEGNHPRKVKLLPLMLANLEGIWYLYALKHPLPDSPGPELIHMYRLNRMTRVRTVHIQVPDGWDRKALLKRIQRGVGAWQGGEEESVTLRIDGDKVGFMRERSWSPGHRFIRQRDGSWLLRFKASNVEHLAPLVLQWGPDIEVLEPAHLRAKVAWAAGLVEDRHSGKSGM